MRSTDARFLKLAEGWWNVLLPRVAPFLHKNGGPILMVQVTHFSVQQISTHGQYTAGFAAPAGTNDIMLTPYSKHILLLLC